jgi:Fe-S-cluster-containing dehydrogenase component
VACAIENNVPPAQPGTTSRTGVTWLQVKTVHERGCFPVAETVYVPLMCQQCAQDPPCVSVCPQKAVEVDPATGIVTQIPQRCLGCRYCMAACPYHARFFNWHDPRWPEGTESMLNPDVAPRMRGVVEKCNLCHGRLHRAREKAARDTTGAGTPADYVPACVEACPTGAIRFGDLSDPASEISAAIAEASTFRLLPRLGTEPRVYYRSTRPWVRSLGTESAQLEEIGHG